MSCDRNICYAQDYNGGCESCPCNPDSKEKIIGPIEKIRREIDMHAFEEMREEEQ